MINIGRLAKKFNLNILNSEDSNKEIKLNQAATIHEIENNEKLTNLVAIINPDEDITKHLDKIALVILTKVNELDDKIKEIVKEYNVPVLYTNLLKRETLSTIEAYLLRKIQTPERVHGTLLSVFGEGILIMGASGIGKSELALELINRNHIFVGDDAIDVVSFSGKPIGKAPRMSRDFIEVRGVGIINLKGMFGIQSTIKEHNIDLIVELVQLADVKDSIERIGREYKYKEISGTRIPVLQVPVSSGRSIAPVVEAAVVTFKQRVQDGYIAVDDLTKRLANS